MAPASSAGRSQGQGDAREDDRGRLDQAPRGGLAQNEDAACRGHDWHEQLHDRRAAGGQMAQRRIPEDVTQA
jgi:hypothetical protein